MIEVSFEDITLTAQSAPMGEGWTVAVTGGDLPHLGAAALAEPHPGITDPGERSATVSVLNRTGHRDGVIAELLAKRLAIASGKPVCVTCGIHYNEFSGGKAERVRHCAELLAAQLEAELLAVR